MHFDELYEPELDETTARKNRNEKASSTVDECDVCKDA